MNQTANKRPVCSTCAQLDQSSGYSPCAWCKQPTHDSIYCYSAYVVYRDNTFRRYADLTEKERGQVGWVNIICHWCAEEPKG